jgi:hypothetical protein
MLITPLSKDFLVPDYLSADAFNLQKLFILTLAIVGRAFTFREEC